MFRSGEDYEPTYFLEWSLGQIFGAWTGVWGHLVGGCYENPGEKQWGLNQGSGVWGRGDTRKT